MKRLILVLTLVSTPVFAEEDYYTAHGFGATSRALENMRNDIADHPWHSPEPRGVETAHPYTYVTPNGDYGNVYLQRRD